MSSDSPATSANTYQPRQLQWSSLCMSLRRRISATPLPVSMALAGQTSVPVLWRVHPTSITAQTRIATRIWGTDTRNPSATWPRTWIEMITAARWSRGSRMFGATNG